MFLVCTNWITGSYIPVSTNLSGSAKIELLSSGVTIDKPTKTSERVLNQSGIVNEAGFLFWWNTQPEERKCTHTSLGIRWYPALCEVASFSDLSHILAYASLTQVIIHIHSIVATQHITRFHELYDFSIAWSVSRSSQTTVQIMPYEIMLRKQNQVLQSVSTVLWLPGLGNELHQSCNE